MHWFHSHTPYIHNIYYCCTDKKTEKGIFYFLFETTNPGRKKRPASDFIGQLDSCYFITSVNISLINSCCKARCQERIGLHFQGNNKKVIFFDFVLDTNF
ncbi:MAG: hypothetical protein B6230_01650 [Desulfobacteraceae bacterium 4572_89]|nr:MAG: hypothetical protein B6230_01650 [Desulfobacteraceae bacterium 4572_89]